MKQRRLRRSIRQIFSGTGLKKGFSDQQLVQAVKKHIAEEQSHTRQRKGKYITLLGRKIQFSKKGIATSVDDFALVARDVLVGKKLERKIIERPGAAAMLAKEFKGTELKKYFEKLAGKAVIMKIAERRKGIQEADRQWAKKIRKRS